MNNKKNLIGSLTLLLVMLTFGNLYSQRTVTSLRALLPYLNDNNANVKLAPGTYNIDGDDVDDGIYGNPILAFEGNNSTYDFTGVTLNINTEVMSKFGNVDVKLVQILGNDNVLKNMRLVNIGTNAPRRSATTLVIDGEDNLLEGFHMTVRGSFPYGYGDAFGKGGNDVVIGHRKHCALLVRGESNHVKNCTVIHRSYGHAIFMQAASNPIIEGCYVEGEMRSTDDMLRERGTGSPADDVDFMTSWGYRLPAGYMMSLGEEGIRAYNGGTTYINGRTIQRGTSNPTIRNCTVKHMRGGVTLAHASGTIRAENCTTIGCEQGFGLGSGTAINCKTDISHGHAFKSTYDNDRWNLDIEIIPAVDPYYNGQKCIAFIGMDNSDLKITGGDPRMPSNYRIQVGGKLDGVRFKNGSLENQSTHNGNNNEVINQTSHPIEIASGSSGNDISTCGSVSNRGSNNSVSQSSACGGGGSSSGSTIVQIRKRNASGFAFDGGVGGENGQNVYLWSQNPNNRNQQWVEIDRGNGFYSYQKQGTNFCIDGNRGGEDGQNAYLWTCSNSNQNQHWKKVSTSGGAFRLEKRNSPSYSLDGNGGGENGQNVYLWTSNNNNQNQQWLITPVGSAKSVATIVATDGVIVYPNPVVSTATMQGAANTTISIYDISGKQLLVKEIGADSEQVDLSVLPPGVYYGQVIGVQSISTIKIVKK